MVLAKLELLIWGWEHRKISFQAESWNQDTSSPGHMTENKKGRCTDFVTLLILQALSKTSLT